MKNYNYEFIVEPLIESVINRLKRDGLALIPGYLDAEQVACLNAEFARSLKEDSASVYARSQHPTNRQGMTGRLDPRHSRAVAEFPAITSTFSSDFMRQVADAYYAPHDYSFNEAVFITNEFASEVPILPWHFDRVQSLKFWFYLTDTTRENGAFEYCPGTHWEGRYRAGYHLSQGCAVIDMPNDIDEELVRNPVALELKAGDLLIFDADGFHRGGVVQEGHERRVLRAHTYPTGRRYSDKPFSSGWWVRSPLNINRWFKSATTRILGDRIREGTVNRKQNRRAKAGLDD